MVKRVCDCCGNVNGNVWGYCMPKLNKVEYVTDNLYEAHDEVVVGSVDLCEKCARKIIGFVEELKKNQNENEEE